MVGYSHPTKDMEIFLQFQEVKLILEEYMNTKKLKSNIGKEPIQEINILPSATTPPCSVALSAELNVATTLMMINNYSQLLVLNDPKKSRNIKGIISWKSIGLASTNGIKSTQVKDYMTQEYVVVKDNMPLSKAIKIAIKKEFIVIQKEDGSFSGIVTLSDISSYFVNVTKPFLLLEEIENHTRLLLDDKFLPDDFNNLKSNHQIKSLDELTFGDYIVLIENDNNWKKLNISIDKTKFLAHLVEVRDIRNKIMHFNPSGITSDETNTLLNMANFLTQIREYYLKNLK